MSSNRENNGANGINLAAEIDALTADLVSQSETFSEYLRAPASKKVPGDLPAEVQAAKEMLLENALQIFNLVSGPTEYIQNVLIGVS
jgi:6-hydroxytryprostatin B O-methyltransferase